MVLFYGFQTPLTNLTSSLLHLVNPLEYLKLFFSGESRLSSNEVAANGFVNSRRNRDPFSRPDLQLHMTAMDVDADYGAGLFDAFSYREEAFEHKFGRHFGRTYGVQVMPTLLRPKSRGSVHLFNSKPQTPPVIALNYLSDAGKEDVRTLVEGAKLVHKLQDTKAEMGTGGRGCVSTLNFYIICCQS